MKLNETIKTGNLIGKYLTGKETETDREQIKNWLKEDEKNQKLFKNLKSEKEIVGSIEEFENYNKELAWKRYLEQLKAISLQKILFRWKIAAVFFFVVASAGVLSYMNNQFRLQNPSDQLFTTVATTNGETSKVVLPDSSIVWINSGTTLSYNANFGIHNRNIKLNGQAYFQVKRNESIPLFVDCNKLKVKVLGTKFDVSSYPDAKEICVVLESGSVELLNDHDKSFDYLLKPGEMARYSNINTELLINKADIYKFTSWKDGVLIFKDDPMTEVFEKLERWYNIDIEIKSQKVEHQIFNATIVNENVEEIFDLIKFTCGVNYSIVSSNQPEIPRKVIITE